MGMFKKKTPIEDLMRMRDEAELKLKINLTEEVRVLNKWIKEFEEYEQFKVKTRQLEIKDQIKAANLSGFSFPYQDLFEQHSFEQLKFIAKQVFISPVFNWSLFLTLKKRLETAYEIQRDLKFMLREFQLMSTRYGIENIEREKKLKIGRVQPYLSQYLQNCLVKGISEIDSMLKIAEEGRQILREISQSFMAEGVDLKKAIADAKVKLTTLPLDMEAEENKVRIEIWSQQIKVLKAQYESSEPPETRFDMIQFKELDSDFHKLKITKEKPNELAAWFRQIKSKVSDILKRMKSTTNEEQVKQLEAEVETMEISRILDLKQILDDKNAQINLIGGGEEQWSVSSS